MRWSFLRSLGEKVEAALAAAAFAEESEVSAARDILSRAAAVDRRAGRARR